MATQAETLLRKNRELAILNEIAQALNRETDLDRALHAILAQVADLLDLETGWVWLIREGSEDTYLAAAQNLPPGLADQPHRMEGSCYCLDTFLAGDLGGAANVSVVTCSRLSKLVDGTAGLRYHASIPLYAHSEKLGVLNVASSDWRELSEEDLQLLYTIGDMLSIAVERASLFEGSIQTGALEERYRLARDIHDTLAQGLAAISLQLETAEALLDRGDDRDAVHNAIHEALNLSRQNLEEARRSVQDLRAVPLEGRSLSEAIGELVAEAHESGETDFSYTFSGDNRPLSARLETGLFRIAQEAVNNVLRHARASWASVSLDQTPSEVVLSVEDNGKGFDVDLLPDNRYGLQGMQERAQLLGGSLEIQSERGSGTRVQVRTPGT